MKYEEAINAYDQAIKINPEDAWNWYYKGKALSDLGKYEESISMQMIRECGLRRLTM
jgi:tetratricopeptide (TPR) repeat protein